MKPWIKHTLSVIKTYAHEAPLHLYLKKYFKQHPILGSRDRKVITQLTYSWYRVSKALPECWNEEKKLLACTLIASTDFALISKIFGVSEESLLQEKKDAHDNLCLDLLIAKELGLSKGIEKREWLNSILAKPLVFVRLRPGFEHKIDSLLQSNELLWQDDACLAFEPTTNLEKLLPPNSYVIQDYASQKAIAMHKVKAGDKVWDCCSGAGGKALWLADHKKMQLFCTDIRPSILQNLKTRFKLYQLKMEATAVIDLEVSEALQSIWTTQKFDYIIADVPCSGSGTWARTPEDLYFFQPETIKKFITKQKNIVRNIWPYLKPGGYLHYITCSVFFEENEVAVSTLLDKGAEIIGQGIINGTSKKADSMYYALLKKSK